MGPYLLAGLRRAAAAALTGALLTASAYAAETPQTTANAVDTTPGAAHALTTIQAGTHLQVQPLNPPQHATVTRTNRLMNPYDRLIAPTLAETMRQNAGAQPASVSRYAAEGVGGTSVRMPGFVAAPYLAIQNGDTSGDYTSVSADFNNDGNVDIATVQMDGTLNVVLNPGSFANIANVVALAPNTSENANQPDIAWLVAADLNSDGYPDLVAQDVINNEIVVWIGNGDGTFKNATIYAVSPKSGASWAYGGAIVVGDFNGDGFPDVATVEINLVRQQPYTSVITEQTFLNDGKGNLLPPNTETDSTFKDFYLANYGQADILSNDGNSISGIGFLLRSLGANGEPVIGASIITFASNGDGTFAPAVEPANPLVLDYETSPCGSFAATNLTAKFSGASASSVKGMHTSSKIKSYTTLGTGIPTTDIVFMTGDGAIYDAPYSKGNPTTVRVLSGFNTQASAFGSSPAPSVPGVAFQDETVLNVADLDGDGYQDVMLFGNGTAFIFPNGGKAAFTAAPIQLVGGTGGDQQPQPADFDGSGNPSFVWVDALVNQVGFYQNLGAAGTAHAGQFYAAAPVAGTNTTGKYVAFGNVINAQVAADLNGDGLADVVAYDWSNYMSNLGYPDLVWGINQGAGTGSNEINNFSFTTVLTGTALSTLGGQRGLAFVEPVPLVNAAGTSVLLATYGGMYMVTSGAGGVPGTPTALNMGTTPFQCAVSFGDVGDINGDGVPDLVFPYEGDTSCYGNGPTPSGYFTLLGNANGSFQPATFTPYGHELFQARLISFGGSSGSMDLALSDQDYSALAFGVTVLPGNGDGTFNSAHAVTLANNYVISDIIPGDYNSDGYQDLTLTTQGQYDASTHGFVPNTAGVLLIPGHGNYTFGTPALVNPGYFAIWGSYADFNGDGSPDLALAEYLGTGVTYTPALQILPNLGGGNFGPATGLMDSFYSEDGRTVYAYTFPGNWGNSGGADLVVTSGFNTAEFINQGVTSLVAGATPSTVGQGSPVTLTATISQKIGGPVPSGSVTFSVGGVLLGSSMLSGNSATLTTTALPVGSDTVTATYSGDEGHNASTATVNVTVTQAAPAFTMAAGQGSLTLTPGATGTVGITLASNGTFSGVINFSCSGAPTEATCSVTPTTLTLGPNQSGNIAVVVATTPKNNQYQASNHSLWKMTTGGISMAGLLLIVLPRRRRLYGTFGILALSLISLASVAALSGCGSTSQYPGTPAGTTNVTVTATSGSITLTQTIAVTITAPQP